MKDQLEHLGYNREEEYFYKANKELIEKQRKALDKDRLEQQKSGSGASYWLVCPKCGESMKEIDVLGVKVDRCGGCGGTYFDKGEIDLLLQSKENSKFLSFFKSFIK